MFASELPSAPPPRRSNRGVLLDEFTGHLNHIGPGAWARPRGTAADQLGEALQLAVTKERGLRERPPLDIIRELAARWLAYCSGCPENAFQARDWLGKGSPGAKAVALPPGVAREGKPGPKAKLPPRVSDEEHKAGLAIAQAFDLDSLRG